MAQGKRCSPEVQQQVLTYLEMKKSVKWITEKTGLGERTIFRIKKRGCIKYENEYSTQPGRPRKVSTHGKRKIRSFIEKNDRKTLHSTKKELKLDVSKATLSRVFREIGISRRKMVVKPVLTSAHEKKRVDWALSRCDPSFDWSRWIFSDEKKFNLDGPDGYRYYWKLDGMDPKIYSRDSNSRSSVMVWGGISKNGCTSLVEVPKKMDSKKYCTLLEEGLLPYYDDGDIFQQDGAPCHTSKETKKFLEEKGIKTVAWPAKSPDLNPIENVWSWMVKEIYFGKPAYKTVNELKEAIFDAWKRIPDSVIDKLIDSMPHRLHKVIEKKGKSIDY
jgi:transposase